MGLFTKNTKTDEKQDKVDKSVEKTADLTIDEITKAKSSKKAGKEVKQSARKETKNAYKVLVRPLITEKASHLKTENKYLFEVNKKTTKNEIKKAIFHVYGYWPENINIINIGGKKVRYGKHSGTTSGKKKAVVTLKKGDSIEVYEGV